MTFPAATLLVVPVAAVGAFPYRVSLDERNALPERRKAALVAATLWLIYRLLIGAIDEED